MDNSLYQEPLFDNEFTDNNNTNEVISKNMEQSLKDNIKYKIENKIQLTEDELGYLRICRNLFIPETTIELKSLLNLFISQEIYSLNCINISHITDMRDLFHRMIYRINGSPNIYIEIDDWDVSNVVNMEYMFAGCDNMQCDLSKWDVSNVQNMSYMFYNCNYFNSDLSKWNTSNVEVMTGMFAECYVFNSDLSNWDVHNVYSIRKIFYDCKSFNCDLSRWDVSNVQYVSEAFYNCKNFNSDLSKWRFNKKYKVTNFNNMFYNCEKFNCDLSSWDENVINVQTTYGMFYNCKSLKCNIDNWKCPSLFNSRDMFNGCATINKALKSPYDKY